MRARFSLLLLLGIVFLASVCVSLEVKPRLTKCLQSCESEKDPYKRQVCQDRCKLDPGHEEHEQEQEEEEEKEKEHQRPRHEERGRRERGRQEGEKAEEEREEQEWRGLHRREDPEERERVRQREEKRREREEEEKNSKEQREESRDSESESQRNPFYFSSNSYRTVFKNQHALVRVLQRFDQSSRQLQNLREYRVLNHKYKPNAFLLPHHADADHLLVVLSGRAILTFVNSDGRDSYNLERGDAQRIHAGTTYYLVNPDDKDTLRFISLSIPVNHPHRFENFFLSSTEDQQSYLKGFSKNVLEASLDTEFEEINSVLFGEEGQRQEKGVVVKVSKEQIRELTRHAKSSSRKTTSSEDEPFNLRDRKPLYSNKFGKFFEITPENNPQLRDLDIFVSYVDMNEGGLMLPHYNSKATVILVINEGKANIELVGLKQQQQQKQQEEQEGPREVHRYRAELSEDDLFIIPSSYPVVVNATSNLNFFAFGINAVNNQRNFLAGEKDNVLKQLHRPVKDLAFPGSAEDVEKLIQNQRESYFVDSQAQQEQEGRKGRKGPLSSILNAF